jgi:anti-sigma regulatory factor (Ser/Thr protein kinase)
MRDTRNLAHARSTNAVRFGGARPISLSLRNFREVLLIEVYDSGSNPPILCSADNGAENGRGLMLVSALSKEWSYFFPPGGGKIVYCFLAKHDPLPRRQAAHPGNGRNSDR